MKTSYCSLVTRVMASRNLDSLSKLPGVSYSRNTFWKKGKRIARIVWDLATKQVAGVILYDTGNEKEE